MNQKLSPALIELVKDACWKAFWRKNNLKTFLRQHNITDVILSPLDDETKKVFLDYLFDLLIKQKDNKGHCIILGIGKSLAEMKHFPDLENLEDSSDKIAKAKIAVQRLKTEIDAIDQKQKGENAKKCNHEKEQEKLKEIQEKQISFETLKNRLDKMLPTIGTQKAGYDFETWIYDLATFQEIQARRPYRDCNNRQIDGSLTIDGTTFLIEAKFTTERVNVDDIDSFFAKIERKADNTMGIMISISGFDEGAIKAASKDKTTMLLMDYSHLYNIILPQIMTFPDVIRRIKRHASQAGEAYLDTKNFSK